MVSAVIVAAGKGTRMGPDVDKLFLEVAGRPVIAHTWQRFCEAKDIDEIIVVVREGMQSAFKELSDQFNLKKPFKIVSGGVERQDSVWNGLNAICSESEIVAIQDGARPCTSDALISATIKAARDFGAAVAGLPMVDTVKETLDGQTISRNMDRSRLWSVQTPQAFRVGVILRALKAVRDKKLFVTDDTAACELIGQAVQLVAGSSPNPKVTVPADLPYINLLLEIQLPSAAK